MSTPSPLITILMLTYNRAPYIGAAIESVLAQTYQNYRLVILDDGSTDDTATIVRAYTDPRIVYHKDPQNKGLYRKRAESLAYATGEYVAILDSDDYWTDNTKLEQQVAFMEQHRDCAVVGTFITHINSTGTVTGQNSYHTDDTAIRLAILWRNQFANSSVLIRHSAIKKTTGYVDLAPSEDYELFLQLGLQGKFANIPLYTLAYRIHENSESARKVIHARQILRTIALHRHHYRGALAAYTKYSLYYLLARLRLI
jgi:glycosyltransferase involved in cell wall biosynthesis